MIKVSDFIFHYLVEKYGIKHCFWVTGGGAVRSLSLIASCVIPSGWVSIRV